MGSCGSSKRQHSLLSRVEIAQRTEDYIVRTTGQFMADDCYGYRGIDKRYQGCEI